MERIISDSGKYFATIDPDEFAENPRKEWDHLGTFVYSMHAAYQLGDEGVDPEEWEAPADSVVLPVYLLDHSGLRLSTERFACDPQGWDSGLYGYIYMTRQKAREEGFETDAQIIRCLRSEIEEMDQYVSGDVYIVSIFEVPEDKEPEDVCLHCAKTIDCCCGFYGYGYAVESAKDTMNSLERREN